ncbi:MAG: GtrA family protein [Spirochaetia bacterium]|nr:GtrA family protein [Spirochaetia bacterium]MBQ3713786.1 GtrA family protein [Spirochaetia bacterium]MBQ6673307.1 GtrA family protein [Spirochaetia bacterium]MBR0318479.1 GtrA family protein [Spirochaetia bacterium]
MIKKVFSFIVWGLATTALNVGFFLLFRHLGVPLTSAVIIAWFLSVTFSYFANKKMVFQDRTSGFGAIIKSMLLFYGSRAFSGLMDVVLMNVFVKILGWDELVSKLINEVLVSTFNFLFCFLVVFRKKKPEENNNG